MSGMRQNIQYSLALVPEGRGEAPVRGHQGTEPPVAKPTPESPACEEQLMEEVCARGNLVRAWKRVRNNKGSPGVDGMTIEDAKAYLRERWPTIRSQLLSGTYQPQPVKRVEIPKPDGGVSPVDEGTPQGGQLSPLLSNLVLDDLDKELTRRGLRFCRYADDANIYVRSRRAGERVMASVSRFLTTKLRLKVNEAKSTVARPEERKFLGFSISNDGSERRIAPKALDKFKTQIRDMTRRTRGISLPQLIEDVTPYLIGWRGYFGFCQTPRVLTNLEAWIRRRLRSYLWRQWQNGPNRFKELRRRGVPKFNAAVAAGSPTGFWRMSRHPAVQQALRNHYFASLGLPRLFVSAQA